MSRSSEKKNPYMRNGKLYAKSRKLSFKQEYFLEEQRSQLLSEATFELILQERRAEIINGSQEYEDFTTRTSPGPFRIAKPRVGTIKIPALCLFWLKDIVVVSCPKKRGPRHRHLRHVHDLADAHETNFFTTTTTDSTSILHIHTRDHHTLPAT